MFKGLISNFVIRDSILILIPNEVADEEVLILVSHGSGGPGPAESNIAEYFLKHGYTVGLVDYFSPHNVSKLFWSDREDYKDTYSAKFKDMFAITIPEYKRVVHIGFSLGGTLGLFNSEKFYRNYCFYPGMIGMSKFLLDKDYSNTTVITAEHDNWCDDYHAFHSECKNPPKRLIAKDCYHGFMIPDKNKTIPIVKYFTNKNITKKDFANLGPNHNVLAQYFDYTHENIILRYNAKECIMYMNMILKDLLHR